MIGSADEMAVYRATARERARQSQQRLQERFEHAKVVAGRAAMLLKGQYNVACVQLFGSLVHPQRFHHRSDIDLAVWGLPEQDYCRAVGQLQAVDAEFAIDLIRIEEASPSLRATIEEEGMPLSETPH